MKCPKCEQEMAKGFSSANTSLSWIDEDKFKSYIFMDADLSESGIKKLIPWKGEYFEAANCIQCKVVIVDYSKKYDRKTLEAEMIG